MKSSAQDVLRLQEISLFNNIVASVSGLLFWMVFSDKESFMSIFLAVLLRVMLCHTEHSLRYMSRRSSHWLTECLTAQTVVAVCCRELRLIMGGQTCLLNWKMCWQKIPSTSAVYNAYGCSGMSDAMNTPLTKIMWASGNVL